MDRTEFHDGFINFSADVLALVEKLPKSFSGRHIARQLMRSGTSVGANMQESRSAESRADFLHKMQIALKEIRETNYWMILIRKRRMIPEDLIRPLHDRCEALTAMLAKSVITTKKNSNLSETASTQNSGFWTQDSEVLSSKY